MVSASQNARARVRAQLTAEILDVARRRLATSGAAGLSLRAIARELGMVSSAVYRYFPSRDELLTALIVEGYDALGAAAEQAEAKVPGDDLLGRWEAVCIAVREWALAHPHEYALLYGSPVPGYAAPKDTIAPAGRVGLLLCRIVADALNSPPVAESAGAAEAPAPSALVPGVFAQLGLPDDRRWEQLGSALVAAWSGLYGAVSFELFGHTNNIVADHEAHFRTVVRLLARQVGVINAT